MSTAYESSKSAFDEDLILVERVLGHDEEAFHSLYEKYYEKVFNIARGILLDSDDAADAVQEIFTVVFQKLDKFDRRSKFSTWLFRIAVNRSIQQSRRLKWKKRIADVGENLDFIPEATSAEEPTDPAIPHVMAELSPNDRAILTLFYWDELTHQEIADSLGCSPNAAKTRLFRARERFKVIYESRSEA